MLVYALPCGTQSDVGQEWCNADVRVYTDVDTQYDGTLALVGQVQGGQAFSRCTCCHNRKSHRGHTQDCTYLTLIKVTCFMNEQT